MDRIHDLFGRCVELRELAPVDYVGSIYKYYVSCELINDAPVPRVEEESSVGG